MGVVDDIWRAYRSPRDVMRDHLAHSPSEPRALTFLLAAQAVIFIGQWPALARTAYLDPTQPMSGLMLGTALGLLTFRPAYYALAALSRYVAGWLGGQGSHYRARLTLFWSVLVISPLMLLQGLVAGFIGHGVQHSAVSILVFVAFIAIWLSGLRVAEGQGDGR